MTPRPIRRSAARRAQRCRVITFSLADEPSCGGRFEKSCSFKRYVEQVREVLRAEEAKKAAAKKAAAEAKKAAAAKAAEETPGGDTDAASPQV